MIHIILHFSILFCDNSIFRGVSLCGQGVLIMELHPLTDLVDCWGTKGVYDHWFGGWGSSKYDLPPNEGYIHK